MQLGHVTLRSPCRELLALFAGDLRRRGHSQPAVLREEVDELLRGIPVRPEYLDPPGRPLVQSMAALQTALQEATEVARGLGLLRSRFDDLRAEAESVTASLGRESGEDPIALALSLEQDLREAERASDAAAAAQRELARVERVRASVADELAAVDDRLVEIDQRVWQLAAGAEGGRPIDVLQRRLDAHRRADRLKEELETAHPDRAVNRWRFPTDMVP